MNKKQFAVILVCTIIFAFLGGMLSSALFQGSAVMAEEKQTAATQKFSLAEGLFIGVVEKGKFRVLVPKHPLTGFVRLTGIQMQEARPPEGDDSKHGDVPLPPRANHDHQAEGSGDSPTCGEDDHPGEIRFRRQSAVHRQGYSRQIRSGEAVHRHRRTVSG